MKLISNTLFGKYCKSKEKEFSRRIDYLDWYEKTRNNFDNFLEQPLKLEMYVPCDNDEEILKPQYIAGKEVIYNELVEEFVMDKVKEYNEAKENVLFEGFCINGEDENIITLEFENTWIEFYKEHKVFMCDNYVLINVEDLLNYELQLTENAVKQIGL